MLYRAPAVILLKLLEPFNCVFEILPRLSFSQKNSCTNVDTKYESVVTPPPPMFLRKDRVETSSFVGILSNVGVSY